MAGLTNYNYQGAPVALTVCDSGGDDTLDSHWSEAHQVLDLQTAAAPDQIGPYSSINGLTDNLSIAYGTVIENATGGWGNDTLIGNSADNLLFGG